MSDQPVSFVAFMPAIQTAIQVHGNRDGMRVQLDIPESELGTAARLLLWRGKGLKVTVEPVKQVETGGQTRDVSTRTERKSRWSSEEE